MPPDGSPTLAGFVHDAVRREVLGGTLTPGQRLRLVDLASRFGVSQSVVREALTRLSEQHLVVAAPQQGFRVVSLSRPDLLELTEARAELESLVLRLAVRRGDVDWESGVVAAHHRLAHHSHAAGEGGLETWFAAHEEFHHRLMAGCGNRRLIDLAASLRGAADLYRRWSRPIGRDHDRDVVAEHRALLDAVVARDEDAAADVLRRHVERTTAVLLPAEEPAVPPARSR